MFHYHWKHTFIPSRQTFSTVSQNTNTSVSMETHTYIHLPMFYYYFLPFHWKHTLIPSRQTFSTVSQNTNTTVSMETHTLTPALSVSFTIGRYTSMNYFTASVQRLSEKSLLDVKIVATINTTWWAVTDSDTNSCAIYDCLVPSK